MTDQLQVVFVFALATPHGYILFLHCNFTTCYTVLQPGSSITIYIEERELACFLYLCHHQGRRNVGRAGGEVKNWRQWKLMNNKKIVTNYACYCLTTMLASKIIKETIEHVFQFDLDIL